MRRLVGAATVVALLVGCSSSRGGPPSAHSNGVVPGCDAACQSIAAQAESEPTNPPEVAGDKSSTPADTTSGDPLTAACAAVDQFYDDMATYSTSRGQGPLVRDAEAIVEPLFRANTTLSPAADKLYDDAVTLAEYVGSAAFPTTGTPADKQITGVADDCP